MHHGRRPLLRRGSTIDWRWIGSWTILAAMSKTRSGATSENLQHKLADQTYQNINGKLLISTYLRKGFLIARFFLGLFIPTAVRVIHKRSSDIYRKPIKPLCIDYSRHRAIRHEEKREQYWENWETGRRWRTELYTCRLTVDRIIESQALPNKCVEWDEILRSC